MWIICDLDPVRTRLNPRSGVNHVTACAAGGAVGWTNTPAGKVHLRVGEFTRVLLSLEEEKQREDEEDEHLRQWTAAIDQNNQLYLITLSLDSSCLSALQEPGYCESVKSHLSDSSLASCLLFVCDGGNRDLQSHTLSEFTDRCSAVETQHFHFHWETLFSRHVAATVCQVFDEKSRLGLY